MKDDSEGAHDGDGDVPASIQQSEEMLSILKCI